MATCCRFQRDMHGQLGYGGHVGETWTRCRDGLRTNQAAEQEWEAGAGGGIRTLGLRFTKPLLYH